MDDIKKLLDTILNNQNTIITKLDDIAKDIKLNNTNRIADYNHIAVELEHITTQTCARLDKININEIPIVMQDTPNVKADGTAINTVKPTKVTVALPDFFKGEYIANQDFRNKYKSEEGATLFKSKCETIKAYKNKKGDELLKAEAACMWEIVKKDATKKKEIESLKEKKNENKDMETKSNSENLTTDSATCF